MFVSIWIILYKGDYMSDFSDFLAGKQLITKDYLGEKDAFQVFFTEDGWLCATPLALAVGRKFNDWYKQKATQEYISAVVEVMNESLSRDILDSDGCVTEDDLVRIVRGGDGGGSSWIHRKLVVRYATWINPKFGVWCDSVIFDLLSGKTKIVDSAVSQQTQDFIQQSVAKGVQDGIDAYVKSLPPSTSGIIVKETSGNRDGWLSSLYYRKSIRLLKPRLINRVAEAMGFLTKLKPKGWLPLPKAAGYVDNPPLHNGSDEKDTSKVIYNPLFTVFLEGDKITFDGNSVTITPMTQAELDVLPKGVSFMQYNTRTPTVTTILDKAVDGLVDIAKAVVAKLPSASQPISTEVSTSSKEPSEESKKEDDSILSSNVVPLKKSA